MQNNTRKVKFTLLSILAHITLLACIVLHLKNKHDIKTVEQPVIQSYSYSSSQQAKPNNVIHHSKQAIMKPLHKAISSATQKQSPSYSIVSENKQNMELLNILHKVISEKQIYPQTAIELHQSGTVKIGFTLTPTGELKKIFIAKSSGHNVIDEAAIAAAESVSSVPEAKSYLQHDEMFMVDVVFIL